MCFGLTHPTLFFKPDFSLIFLYRIHNFWRGLWLSKDADYLEHSRLLPSFLQFILFVATIIIQTNKSAQFYDIYNNIITATNSYMFWALLAHQQGVQ